MILETNARNAMIAALGTLHNSGTFVLETSGGVEIATLTFAASAFGAPATGVITAAAITADTSATGGTVGRARTFTGATPIATLTVGLSAAEVIMASLTVPVGATVNVTSLTMTQPAS